jgi:DNA-binding NarL/FixJ family response regulator
MLSILKTAGDIEVVGDAATLQGTLDLIGALRPDVVVVDDYLPPLPADRLVPLAQDLAAPMAVVVVTMHDDADLVRRTLVAGARGYLHKTVIYEELSAAVRTVYRGGIHIGARIREMLGETDALDLLAGQASPA